MDAANCQLACGLVSRSYISQGQQSLNARHARVKALLSSRRLPQDGWDEATIEMFIQDLAAMDSNNFLGNVGVGEREARVACPLVARRYWGLAHGIGRSGDIAAEQPKAAGSSLISKLCNILVADALHIAGLTELTAVTVLPLATGMALTMTLLALRPQRGPQARYVVWSRIDQKTCLKCIAAANLQPLVVPLVLEGDELHTDVEGIVNEVQKVGPDQVVCVMTTTSCFAPRGSDDVVSVAKACAEMGVPHIINNAYGVQSAQLCKNVTAACRKGRVDAVIQSSDKNFLVPVGGAVVAAPGGNAPLKLVEAVNQLYPGRAAASAHIDLLLTLLHWGVKGWKKVLAEREELYPYLKVRLAETAEQLGERVLQTPNNPISIALSLENLAESTAAPHPCSTIASHPAPPGNNIESTQERQKATAVAKSMRSTKREGEPTSSMTAESMRTTKGEGEATSSMTAENMITTKGEGEATSSMTAETEEDKKPPEEAPPLRSTLQHGSVIEGDSQVSARVASAAAIAAADTAAGAVDADVRVIPAGAINAAAASTAEFVASATGARVNSLESKPPAETGVSAHSDSQDGPPKCSKKAIDLTMLGSMLWSRFVSGTRVVTGTKIQKVAGVSFQGYGAHHDAYPHQYLTVAAAAGTTREEVDDFCRRLVKCYQEFKRKHSQAG